MTPVFEGVHSGIIEADKSQINLTENTDRFTSLCEEHKITYSISRGDYTLPMPQLMKQTRYSDLLIAGSEVFFRSTSTENFADYLREALHKSECPVVVVPEKFNFPENIVLAYDGSPSSVHAIKQFAYLFPECCNKKLLLAYESKDATRQMPYEAEIRSLIECHFPNVKYQEFRSDRENNLNTWLAGQQDVIVVAGAADRTSLSELAKKSFISELVSAHKIPVFLAHLQTT